MKFQSYTLSNYKKIPQMEKLSDQQIFDIEVVGRVLPFKSKSYVVEELIDWDNYVTDPIFILTFPQKDMLLPDHYNRMAEALKANLPKVELDAVALEIRKELNPNPAGQSESNVPVLNGEKLNGMQHKYDQTVLFFPAQGQTCHAYCTFCFRWSQFVSTDEVKFASKEAGKLVEYLKSDTNITDVLITGGDPMVMKFKFIDLYISAILDANIPHIKNIRIGTKTLGYWPYKYTTDPEAEELLGLFRKVKESGKHLTIMAHFNHYNELKTDAVKEAIKNIKATGAQIRTQSPLLNNINADPKVWEIMWKEQATLGLIPYYMFLARDTGAQHYFAVSLVKAWEIFKEAYSNVSGICRTVRGPSMSAKPGKIHVLGVAEVAGEKVLTLNFIQGREKEWVQKPFFAEYNEDAIWLDDLKPAFNEEKFFFED